MLRFERFRGSLDEWGRILETFPDRPIFQTPSWLRFVSEAQNARPVIAVLKDGEDDVGYFAGLIVRRLGLAILGSPFPGWTTSHMGIRLREGPPRRAALEALVRFAFRDLQCVHLEFMDRQFRPEDAAGLGFEYDDARGFEIDLTPSEEELFAKMSGACRRCIRKAAREGVVIEEADDESFASDYYAQLEDVFAKQALVPTYGERRVRLLIKHLLPTGRLLLLRARRPDGQCIATGIFPAMNGQMYFWGGASWREHQILRPNEALQWYAMRYWKSRGVLCYDMCGGGDYKKKYGPKPISLPWLRRSRFRWIGFLRGLAQRGFRVRQRIQGRRRRAA